jgi:hypothetical protein
MSDPSRVFVGPDLSRALATLCRLQKLMDNRYTSPGAHRQIIVAIDLCRARDYADSLNRPVPRG